MPFFRTSWGAGDLNSEVFNIFHNRVEFGTIMNGLRNLGRFEPPTPLSVRHWIEAAGYDTLRRQKKRPNQPVGAIFKLCEIIKYMNFKCLRILNNSSKGHHLRKFKIFFRTGRTLYQSCNGHLNYTSSASVMPYEMQAGFLSWNIGVIFFLLLDYFSDVNGQQCMCCGCKSCYVPMISKKLHSCSSVTEHRHSSSLDICSCNCLGAVEQHHAYCAVWEDEKSLTDYLLFQNKVP